MGDLLPTRVAAVWGVLVAATAASWWLGTEHGTDDVRLGTTLVIVIAVFKLRLVGVHFMGLGHAPRPLRAMFEAWCAFLLVLLVALYLAL